MPINPVHMALLKNGRVLIVSGSGNNATESSYSAALWDPLASSFTTQLLGWDMFCNGMVTLPDGRVFINGGNPAVRPVSRRAAQRNLRPGDRQIHGPPEHGPRPLVPDDYRLGDGRVMTFSGLDETGATNMAAEFYTPGSAGARSHPPPGHRLLYPRMHLLPDGRVLLLGLRDRLEILHPLEQNVVGSRGHHEYSGTRTYGTSVLLPLMASNGYRARVMILGGGNPATNTTEILDPSATPLRWEFGPAMSQPRIEMNATILPSGKVLAVGRIDQRRGRGHREPQS